LRVSALRDKNPTDSKWTNSTTSPHFQNGGGLESLEDTVSRLREDKGYVVLDGELLKLWSRRFEWGGGIGGAGEVSL